MKQWVTMGALALAFAVPLAVIVLYAAAGRWAFPSLVPTTFSARAVRYLVSQGPEIAVSLLVSVLYSLATVVTTFALCVLPATVLAWESFRGKDLLNAILLAPAVVPAITFAVGAHVFLIKLGLTESVVGIVLVLSIFAYPYMLRALTNGFSMYGRNYDTCAENLGAGTLTRVLRVHLPMLMPSVISGGSVVFLVAFSEYFLVFLIGGGAVPSYTGYLFPFLNGSDQPIASVLTLLFLAVPVLLFAVVDRTAVRAYRKRGMT